MWRAPLLIEQLTATTSKQDYREAVQFIQSHGLSYGDPGMKSNAVELLLAKTLIVRNLGDNWWKGAEAEINAWVGGLKLKSPRHHPLSAFYTEFGSRNVRPEAYGQLLRFAVDLLDSVNESGSEVDSKIPELKSPSFFETWFEIHTASVFIRKGMPTIYVASSKTEKRPDLLVTFHHSEILVECKTRAKLSAEERSSDKTFLTRMKIRLSSAEALLLDASAKVTNPTGPYLIALNIERPTMTFFPLEMKQLRSIIEVFLARNTNVTAVILFGDKAFEEGEYFQFQTELDVILGLAPQYPLSKEFYEIFVNGNIDSRPKMEILASYALQH